MALAPGDTLGPYQIVASIGKGGMGEVFKARDTRLNRDVAIKVSAERFSERFEREARVIASLNHPNICTLYDVGPNYLVMEFIEGESPKGPLPLETVLSYARQMADAFDCAHEKAITHRDLKPANLKITPDGVLKVLDFGLAKVGQTRTEAPSQDSPTLTMGMTEVGMILGTAAYMAPEQAKGKVVDKRADIWAYGVVLYELSTGKRLFKGEDVGDILASVLKEHPDFDLVPEMLRPLLKSCLEKDPKRRLRDIADAMTLVGQALSPAAPRQAESLSYRIVAAVATVVALALAAWTFYPRPAPPRPEAVRFTLPPAKGTTLTVNRREGSDQALSPDGRYVAFLAESGGTRSLWVRALGSQAAQQLDKTEAAIDPFWSPDSKNIAFYAGGKLKRIAVAGGSPISICDATSVEGGTWLQQASADGQTDGVILFAPSQASPILRVPASGGVPSPVTKLAQGEAGHLFPQFLPDGKRFLFFANGGVRPGIYVQALGSGERSFLLATRGRASFAPPDYVLFMSDNNLLAQHVDWDALNPLGEPVLVTDEVRTAGPRNSFSVSSTGALVYRAGSGAQVQYRWFTRDGKPEGMGLTLGDYEAIDLSPDNKRAVVERSGDLWLIEFPGGVLSRLTSDKATEEDAVWSPDSRRIAFRRAGDKPGIYQMLIGSGKDTLVHPGSNSLEAWTRDGLLLTNGRHTVALLPAPKEDAAGPLTEKPRTLLEVQYNVDQLRVSPDGKWVAYMSTESGNQEMWVAAFPGFTDRRKVSVGGARAPLWRADGKELIFDSQPDNFTAVDVKTGVTFEAGSPKILFKMPAGSGSNARLYYAITNDAKRFLVRTTGGDGGGEVEPLQVILNWPALLGK
jgi:eukaryotic-like serine/threonine-protein kinase